MAGALRHSLDDLHMQVLICSKLMPSVPAKKGCTQAGGKVRNDCEVCAEGERQYGRFVTFTTSWCFNSRLGNLVCRC